MTPERIEIDGLTVRVMRSGFRPGYYARAEDAAGNTVAFTQIYRGPGSRQRAIDAALAQAKSPPTPKGA